jgi:excisionase family DNA binding protein
MAVTPFLRRTAVDNPRFVNAAGLAAHWHVSRAHVYNLLQRGLPSVKLGRSRRFDVEAADAWAAQNTDVS